MVGSRPPAVTVVNVGGVDAEVRAVERRTADIALHLAPTCQILPPNFPSYRRSCQYLPGGVAGLDRARRLVRSSGTSGASVTVWVPAPIAVQGASWSPSSTHSATARG